MKRSFILLLAATFSLFSFAQNHEVDPEVARAILEELDAKHESYKAMKVDFELTLDNRQRNTKDTHKGHLDVMGNKFHLDILNSETFSDGKIVYSYSKENNEVTISTIDEEEQASMDPLKILSSWHEGYKLRYLGDAEIDGAFCTEIDLYPEERMSPVVRIRITLDQKTHALRKILQQTKDGMLATYSIIKLTPMNSISDETFTFNKSKYPNVEEIDMR
ncbi:MAG: outer membrane lipoprotein carrier protein LolA [Bacteroidales bacterium]|nr:outer membrane lipoprotein carrier protein LolA [Bacteroidales bacterium]